MLTISLLATAALAHSQHGGPPPTRKHHTNSSPKKVNLVPATKKLRLKNRVSITIDDDQRVITANGIPTHPTAKFPNRGNPHSIAEQKYSYRIPVQPRANSNTTPLGMQSFGFAVNGVPFDPSAAEWYLGERGSKWQYEALSGAVPLGVDSNYAHVQPNGAYHYHGLPIGLLKKLGTSKTSHSPLVGWAADGFPIYALYGYSDAKNSGSKIKLLKSSYLLKKGKRPNTNHQPGGTYDGTFSADYEYVPGSGDLDECNGRYTITPEFPGGTYAYFLSSEWPIIPRLYRGTPSSDFLRRPHRGGRPPRHQIGRAHV